MKSVLLILTLTLGAQLVFGAREKAIKKKNNGKQFADMRKELKLGRRNQLVVKSQDPLKGKISNAKVKMEQVFDGYPVYGSVLTVEMTADRFTDNYQGVIILDIEGDLPETPKGVISERAAVQRLQKSQGHTKSTHDISEASAVLYVKLLDGIAKLVYFTSYTATSTDNDGGYQVIRPQAFIDAQSEEVLAVWNGLTTKRKGKPGPSADTPKDVDGVGANTKVGQALYQFTVLSGGTTCVYSTPSDLPRVEVKNDNDRGRQFMPSSVPCSRINDPSYDAVNGAYSPMNDVYKHSITTVEMFQQEFGEHPMSNGVVQALVHVGRNYENAYWNGRYIHFGDGASYFYPLTSLDIVAHEIAHAFTEKTSGLRYQYQSGGINEAFSDITGEAAKYFFTGDNDWLLGGESMKTEPALRYMCNPTQGRGPIVHGPLQKASRGESILDCNISAGCSTSWVSCNIHPDNAADYTDGLDVHYSSGVYNKAYCLISQSAGYNSLSAFKVFARANGLYWGASTGYNAGACGVISAAGDLTLPEDPIRTAFVAVGVSVSGC